MTAEPDYPRIAQTLADRSRLRPGETVFILTHDEALPLADELVLGCYRAGALPLLWTRWESLEKRAFVATAPETLAQLPRHFAAALGSSDVIIYLYCQYKDPALLRDIPSVKLAALAAARAPQLEVIYDGKRRVIITDFPTAAQARFFGVDYDEYRGAFWAAFDIDYGVLTANVKRVRDFIMPKTEVRITTSKGTDIRLRKQGRPVDTDDGVVGLPGEKGRTPILNLPTGEVCLAPRENGADGTAVFDFAFIGGVRVRDLEVKFENGRAVLVKAAEGLERARETFDAATGEPYIIAELGIGLNPALTKPFGSILMDEKIAGTVHLALGDNRTLGGTNRSSLHQDMIILDPHVTCDGEVLMSAGRLLI